MENVKLISIELTNFKSFGHLQLADMEKSSLFAIVGMNGTGKSNIIDAFLYVLGENRAHNLRIRRYVDLIRVNAASAEGSTPAAKRYCKYFASLSIVSAVFKLRAKNTQHVL